MTLVRQAPAFPADIRLGWNGLKMTNTLAYHSKEFIITTKNIIAQAPGQQMNDLWKIS
jgi:hypothetical protein